ncbi:uncharacterized protein FOMMEDRAFT_25880 [Fomitiporia mediterranea MF3/22]|uniref:uncharacterized protein n=1 Tax=Fomitiporia mediterranea (strain MF3/22) TaxID=694068 RepID=UPI00044099E1|nr:uncharacterized protein FOMMEDRAFT_25880 [Fomitiporia mediterranea MF3/22]EJD06659.1 hypothetical protein FOMMEDRAFT_25880 [Fomitiporia mediterranea MF3/22]
MDPSEQNVTPQPTVNAGKGICWTCRIRRKKCEQPRTNNGCRTCIRLRIECLGWDPKPPAWMSSKGTVKAYRKHIREVIAKTEMVGALLQPLQGGGVSQSSTVPLDSSTPSGPSGSHNTTTYAPSLIMPHPSALHLPPPNHQALNIFSLALDTPDPTSTIDPAPAANSSGMLQTPYASSHSVSSCEDSQSPLTPPVSDSASSASWRPTLSPDILSLSLSLEPTLENNMLIGHPENVLSMQNPSEQNIPPQPTVDTGNRDHNGSVLMNKYYRKSPEQVAALKELYARNAEPSTVEKIVLALKIGLDLERVSMWFRAQCKELKHEQNANNCNGSVPVTKFFAATVERESHQIEALEKAFARNPNPSIEERGVIALEIGMNAIHVSNWFQKERHRSKSRIPGAVVRKTMFQTEALEKAFARNTMLSRAEKDTLAHEIKLHPAQVHNWFTNRRVALKHVQKANNKDSNKCIDYNNSETEHMELD